MRESHIILAALSLALLGAAPSRTQTYTAGELIKHSEVTENEDNIFSYLQAGVDTYRDGTITSGDFSSGSVDAAAIADNAVGASEIAADAVDSSEITANAVGASEIAADAVGTSEIATDGVGAAEIVADAVGTSEIATDGVGTAEIAASAVDTSEINDNAVTATDLSATLTFSDGDVLDLDAINVSSTTEGLLLPQATSCSSGTAEGQICWDTDNDALYLGSGSAAQHVGGAWTFVESLTLSGTSTASSTLPTDSDVFMVVLDDAADTAVIAIQFNGSSAAAYGYTQLNPGATTLTGATAQTSMRLAANNADEPDGWFTFQRTSGPTGHGVACHLSINSDSSATLAGYWGNSAAITSVAFIGSSLSGKAHLYKLNKS